MVIVDTGVLYALADRRDVHHTACVRWFVTARRPLIVPALVVAEACYPIGQRLSAAAEATFLDAFADGSLRLADLLQTDLARMATLVRQYSDMSLGATDASVIATAERLGATEIATTDRRHFSVVVPRHVAGFDLLPAQL